MQPLLKHSHLFKKVILTQKRGASLLFSGINATFSPDKK